MMIQLSDAGKRFNRDWIFRHVTHAFQKGKSYAIVGSNGSGKSTLLQSIAGSMNVSEGKCDWSINSTTIEDGEEAKEMLIKEGKTIHTLTIEEKQEFIDKTKVVYDEFEKTFTPGLIEDIKNG